MLRIGWLAIALLGLLGSPCAVAAAELERAKSIGLAPAPRAADGRFVNWKGPLDQGTLGVHLPFFARRFAGRFRERPGAPRLVANDGVALRERATGDPPTVTWIGHASVLLQLDGTNWLTDPIWSETASPLSFAGPQRFVPPGVALEDLPEIHAVVISHNHYDHLDLATLRALAKRNPETEFLVPLGNAALLVREGIRNVTELDWGEGVRFRGQRVWCVPSQHWSRRGLFDERVALWSAWAIVAPTTRVYFGGDTGYFAGFREVGDRLGPFDLAVLPIGAYEPVAMMKDAHMDPEQAVRAADDLRARHAIGMHFGTFDLTDEPLDEPPRRFRAAAAAAGRAAWVLDVGETRTIPPEQVKRVGYTN